MAEKHDLNDTVRGKTPSCKVDWLQCVGNLAVTGVIQGTQLQRLQSQVVGCQDIRALHIVLPKERMGWFKLFFLFLGRGGGGVATSTADYAHYAIRGYAPE